MKLIPWNIASFLQMLLLKLSDIIFSSAATLI